MDNYSTAALDEIIVYTGFWPRVGATMLDSLILVAVTGPVLISVYGWEYLEGGPLIAGTTDLLLSWVLPVAAVFTFWIYCQATPGKMAISAIIVDAKTGRRPAPRQYLVRYLGYLLALAPLGLGIFWVAWDPKKQGWHDKLAGTLVINRKKENPQSLFFDSRQSDS